MGGKWGRGGGTRALIKHQNLYRKPKILDKAVTQCLPCEGKTHMIVVGVEL